MMVGCRITQKGEHRKKIASLYEPCPGQKRLPLHLAMGPELKSPAYCLIYRIAACTAQMVNRYRKGLGNQVSLGSGFEACTGPTFRNRHLGTARGRVPTQARPGIVQYPAVLQACSYELVNFFLFSAHGASSMSWSHYITLLCSVPLLNILQVNLGNSDHFTTDFCI